MENDKYKNLIDKLSESFAGTYLEGFLEMSEKDYICTDIGLASDEMIVGYLSDAEKRIYTLLSQRMLYLNTFIDGLRISKEELASVTQDFNEEDMMDLQEEVEYRFEDKGEEMPYHIWLEFVHNLGQFDALRNILISLIYCRLLPDHICDKPLLRRNYVIAKKIANVIEDNGDELVRQIIYSQKQDYN